MPMRYYAICVLSYAFATFQHAEAVEVAKRQSTLATPTDTHIIAPASNATQTNYVPINSAGDHDGARKITDSVLLLVALLVPFGIYGGIRASATAAEASTAAPQAGEDFPSRLGSRYHLSVNHQKLSLTPLKDTSTDMDHEGPLVQNVLAGFSTAMAALPDAISFSFITGCSPLNGIWAGCFMGISAALIGGRPGMISSASAATAVVLAQISTDPEYGMGAMALCVFIVGVLQLLFGYLRLSRFIILIPHPVMLGFVNGLAIVMIRAQLRQFRHQGSGEWVETPFIISMSVTALFAMFVAVAWSKLGKVLPERIAKVFNCLPSPLVSVVLTTLFSIALGHVLPRRTLEHVAGARTFRGGLATLPSWNFPPAGVDWQSHVMWYKVSSVAVRFAIVGLLESLMTKALIDQITNTKSSARRECYGQGVGNILASLFGCQGGCALIAQSLMNVGSGGLSRVSGLVMGASLGVFVVALAPIMAVIPVAALVGLIALIALNTFAWSSLELIMRVNWVDSVVVVVVTVVTVWKDLAIAVVSGLVINALGFAWITATHVRIHSEASGVDERTFYLQGPLFFGSAMNYMNELTMTRINETKVVMDFTRSRILDVSGSDAIIKTRQALVSNGHDVILRGVPVEMRQVMKGVPPEAFENTFCGK